MVNASSNLRLKDKHSRQLSVERLHKSNYSRMVELRTLLLTQTTCSTVGIRETEVLVLYNPLCHRKANL